MSASTTSFGTTCPAWRTMLWKMGSGRCRKRTMGVNGSPWEWKDADIRGADEGRLL